MTLTDLGRDLDGLVAALTAARLPTDDVRQPDRAFYRFERDGAVAYGGLEGCGSDWLLRSVVVEGERGNGLGSAILGEIERHAAQRGVERLHLLTNTAAPFFEARGYVRADRADAPPQIAASQEFSRLCPASATYLVKRLGL